MPIAYISMGSNLENPPKQLEAALESISRIPGVTVDAISNTYLTEPQECVAGAAWFHNKAIRISCVNNDPEYLLKALQAIEKGQGRARGGINGGCGKYLSRTIDLDLLLFGEAVRKTPELTLPHPRMRSRAFVLVPLSEVALPGFVMPGGDSISKLLALLEYEVKDNQIWQTA